MGFTQPPNYSLQASSTFTIPVLFASASLLFGCNHDSGGPPPTLSDLTLSAFTVQGTADAMYPQFDELIQHYAVRCMPSDLLTLTATASDSSFEVSIDGRPPEQGRAEIELASPSPDQDIIAEVSIGSLVKQYVLHCLAEDFPEIQVLRAEPEVTPDLILVAPKFRVNGERKTYIIILDNNGVPRFRRKIEASVNDFKRHPDGTYTYALNTGPNQFGLVDSVFILLDENFNEIDQIQTVGLGHTDTHDIKFTEDGHRILISYHSTVRDMTAFGLSADEVVGDSLIQESTSDGQVVFQWDSWDHIDLAGCTDHRGFPTDYAHLNSIDLTPDGDLIGSFRGCSQVLKIDRPSGDVIWRLGGNASDFLIVGDSFNEFCGQHTAWEIAEDRILMFDNGNRCRGPRETTFGEFSRVVEYRLDFLAGQAHFVRDHSLNGTYQEFSRSQGSVQLLANGNWLISWGSGPEMSITEVNPSGDEIFAMKILFDDAIAVSYRAFREASLPLN